MSRKYGRNACRSRCRRRSRTATSRCAARRGRSAPPRGPGSPWPAGESWAEICLTRRPSRRAGARSSRPVSASLAPPCSSPRRCPAPPSTGGVKIRQFSSTSASMSCPPRGSTRIGAKHDLPGGRTSGHGSYLMRGTWRSASGSRARGSPFDQSQYTRLVQSRRRHSALGDRAIYMDASSGGRPDGQRPLNAESEGGERFDRRGHHLGRRR